MNPLLSKNLFYLPVQRLRGEPILRLLKEYQETENLNAIDLKDYQTAKLRKLLSYIFQNVPYFRLIQKEYSLDLHEDPYRLLQQIPIMTKEMYISNLSILHADSIDEKIDSRQTSGSSGIPLNIVKGRESFARHRAIMYRYYSWHGIEIGDRQCRFFGHPVTFLAKMKENIQDFILNKYRLDPVYMGTKELYSFYKIIKKLPTCYFYGYASAIDEFARFIQEDGVDTKNINISCVVTAGETLYNYQRKNIEKIFNTKVINEYGCSEVGIIAMECPAGNMHVSVDNLFVEIVKDGNPVEYGESGEIIVTELNNYTVPFVRYAIGDIGSISKEKCICGCHFDILKTLEGRSSEMILLPTGRKVHTEVFHYISDVISERKMPVEQFRIIQKNIDNFEIQIVLRGNYKNSCKEKNDIQRLMKKLLIKVLDDNLTFKFSYIKELSKDPSGKLRYFISEM